MKRLKTLISIFLALTMIFGSTMTAFATDIEEISDSVSEETVVTEEVMDTTEVEQEEATTDLEQENTINQVEENEVIQEEIEQEDELEQEENEQENNQEQEENEQEGNQEQEENTTGSEPVDIKTPSITILPDGSIYEPAEYSVTIQYDTMNFSYEAESITWDKKTGNYVVNLKDSEDKCNTIRIINNTTGWVGFTANLNHANSVAGMAYTMKLYRDGQMISGITESSAIDRDYENRATNPEKVLGGIGDTSQLDIIMSDVSFSLDTGSFGSTQIATVSLFFREVTNRDSEGGGTAN